MRLKAETKEQASLKAEHEARFYEELRMEADKDKQELLREEEDTHLAEELRLKAEAGGLCGAGMDI